MKILLILIAVFSMSTYGLSQEALTAEINNATKAEDCEDGSIDLTIYGGFPPYDVIWNWYSTNPFIPLTILDYHTADGVQGNNDGEDIDAPAPSR